MTHKPIHLFLQIPCYNEEHSLPVTWNHLPMTLPEFPQVIIHTVVIDDGSHDRTVEVAHELGVEYVVRLRKHAGLAKAWTEGIKSCLELGADIIINLDADNQYDARSIPDLIRPIIQGNADMVIGARTFEDIPYFTPLKCKLQRLGSRFVSMISGLDIPDATSGFRAYSRHAASILNVFSTYTYTLETILHAGHLDLAVVSVPVKNNPKLRESRLLKSTLSYIRKSILTMTRIAVLYNPFRFFAVLSTFFLVPALFIGLRFAYYWAHDSGQGKIQSIILCAVLLIFGMNLLGLGVISTLIATNRRMLEMLYGKSKLTK